MGRLAVRRAEEAAARQEEMRQRLRLSEYANPEVAVEDWGSAISRMWEVPEDLAWPVPGQAETVSDRIAPAISISMRSQQTLVFSTVERRYEHILLPPESYQDVAVMALVNLCGNRWNAADRQVLTDMIGRVVHRFQNRAPERDLF
jgi:hypothetical protein